MHALSKPPSFAHNSFRRRTRWRATTHESKPGHRETYTLADYEFPKDLAYTAEDEWIRREGDEVVIGVTDFAQDQLGDIVFVELPDVGSTVEAGASFGTIESVKAVSDLYAPLAGEVTAINEDLEDVPEKINEACYGEGWLIRLRPSDAAQMDALLDATAYAASVAERDQ